MENVAYIYQPHFKTSMFRAAVRDQQSKGDNYIVVMCSTKYNGVWKYSGKLHESCGRIKNNNLICYEVPVSECVFVQTLDSIKDPAMRSKIADYQKKWIGNDVKGRDYKYQSMPDWVVRELKN